MSFLSEKPTSNIFVLFALIITGLFYAPYWLYKQNSSQDIEKKPLPKFVAMILFLELALMYIFALLYDVVLGPSLLLSNLIDCFGILFYLTLVISCYIYGKNLCATHKLKSENPNILGIFLFHILYLNYWQNKLQSKAVKVGN